MSNISFTDEWAKLVEHQQSFEHFSIAEAFDSNKERAAQLSLRASGIFLDFSKNLITEETVSLLLDLGRRQSLDKAIEHLSNGDIVNTTENRQALHHLLRCQSDNGLNATLKPLYAEVVQVRDRMKAISNDIYTGKVRGYTGKPFTDVVHIGIGGSDLGPAMVYQALKPYQQKGISCHFVSNICANDIIESLESLNPHTTLFIVASKTFTTLETIKNADTAKKWLLDTLLDSEAIARHFMAVTSKPERAQNYGIQADNIFPFWDWVGGRYSVWSAIGLSLCIGLGYDTFADFLKGGASMDEHFFTTPHRHNLPVISALLGVWYNNFWHSNALLIAPYDHRLRRFPAFLQQLEMESTGKLATLSNECVTYETCPVIWGEVGANSQHSFFQRLHQGPDFVPVDFIVALKNHHSLQDHQDWLFANCLAQSQALLLGQMPDEGDLLGKHKWVPGNRPSTTIVLESLTPQALGSLIALYEHKVYVQSVIWDINAFDQWGVELGKAIGNQVKAVMDKKSGADNFDGSTLQLLNLYQSANNKN